MIPEKDGRSDDPLRLFRTGKRWRVLALFCLLCMLPTGRSLAAPDEQDGAAGSGVVRGYTLSEILRLGLEASPKLAAERHIIEEAEAQLGQARAGRYPRLEFLQIAGLVPEARGDAVFSPDDRSDVLNDLGPFTRIEITLNQPLYTFGRLKQHILAAEKGLEAKQLSLRRVEQEVLFALKELYYTVQLNEELHRLVDDTREQFAKAVNRAEEQLDEGTGTLTQQDLLKLRYGLFRASGQLLEIEKGRRLTLAALRRLLSLPEGDAFALADSRLKAVTGDLAELSAYIDMARQHRPEWRQLEAGIAAREAELRVEQSGYLPDIFLSGLFRYAVAPNRDSQENPFVVDDFNYLEGGAYMGWRLALDFGLPQRIAAKRAEVQTLRTRMREADSGMVLEVERAYLEAVEKRKGLTFAREARKSGRALAAMSAANFHLGIGEAKEVFEAFKLYTEAAAQYYLAVKDNNMAVAELARVTGKVEGIEQGP